MTNHNAAARRHENVDQGELDQFARQAGQWWNPHGPFRPLHQIGPVRLKYIRDISVRHFQQKNSPPDELKLKPLKELTCLDVGCGGGLISEPLARLGATVTGIDPAPENIAAARAHGETQGLAIDYRAQMAEEVLADGAAYDLVICLEVIEHVPEPANLVATLTQLLRPGGLLIMSTINRTPKSYMLAIVGAEYILRWLPVGTHQWDKFVRPGELKRYMTTAGFDQFSSMGVTYNPLTDRWSLSDDIDVNYMAAGWRA